MWVIFAKCLLLLSTTVIYGAESEEVQPACSPNPGTSGASRKTEAGFYLGAGRNSRVTYNFDAKYFKKLNVSIDVRTTNGDGIVFYVAGSRETQYFALHLMNSKLFCSYNCGDGVQSYPVAVIISDGQWHTIKLTSDEKYTQLSIDDTFRGQSSGCKNHQLVSPYYFGSVDPSIFANVTWQLEGQSKSFIGCMKNIEVDKISSASTGIVPCVKNVETGTFLTGTGSYAIAYEHFKVGKTFEISVEIKPKTNNGVLAVVHSAKGYLILQLVNGTVKFTVDNGNGPVTSTSNPSSPVSFCDNKWHKIDAYKSKQVLILTVDGEQSKPLIDSGGSTTTDTYDPLYIGGYPTSLKNAPGIEVGSEFVGCIRNLRINEREEDFTTFNTTGIETFNMCAI